MSFAMKIELDIKGDIVERQDLLNGMEGVTLSGSTADGAWALDGALLWSRGMGDGGGEGDITLVRADGSSAYGVVASVTADGPAEGDGGAIRLRADIDGGSGGFEATRGRCTAEIRLSTGEFSGRWCLDLDIV